MLISSRNEKWMSPDLLGAAEGFQDPIVGDCAHFQPKTKMNSHSSHLLGSLSGKCGQLHDRTNCRISLFTVLILRNLPNPVVQCTNEIAFPYPPHSIITPRKLSTIQSYAGCCFALRVSGRTGGNSVTTPGSSCFFRVTNDSRSGGSWYSWRSAFPSCSGSGQV